jgi:hypothetical protein
MFAGAVLLPLGGALELELVVVDDDELAAEAIAPPPIAAAPTAAPVMSTDLRFFICLS